MTPVERDDVAHAVTQVQAFFGKELDALQMKFWLRALAELDATSVKRALADYTSLGKYAPKPRDIIDLVETQNEKRRRELPPPEKQKTQEAPEHVRRAWVWLISQWGVGDMYGAGKVTDAEADAYALICNQQAKANNNPDSIPPHCWLESVWGCSAIQKQSPELHEAAA